jgi:hypothetical protein
LDGQFDFSRSTGYAKYELESWGISANSITGHLGECDLLIALSPISLIVSELAVSAPSEYLMTAELSNTTDARLID